MDDKDIVNQIGELAAEEQRLEEAHVGEGLTDDVSAKDITTLSEDGPATPLVTEEKE